MEDQGSPGTHLSAGSKFNLTRSFVAMNPGRHQVCVYLYDYQNPDGDQFHKGAGYKVRP